MARYFSVSIDNKMDKTLKELQKSLGGVPRSEVFLLSIALMKIAVEAEEAGHRLKSGHKEIMLPTMKQSN